MRRSPAQAPIRQSKKPRIFSLKTKISIRDEVEKVRRDKFEIIKNISRITDEDKLEKN